MITRGAFIAGHLDLRLGGDEPDVETAEAEEAAGEDDERTASVAAAAAKMCSSCGRGRRLSSRLHTGFNTPQQHLANNSGGRGGDVSASTESDWNDAAFFGMTTPTASPTAHAGVCLSALKEAGFEVLDARDVADDVYGPAKGGKPWMLPLMPSWNPFTQRF